MAEVAVSVSLILLDKALPWLNRLLHHHRTVGEGMEWIRTWLQRVEAYLAEMDGNEGRRELCERRETEVRDVANKIEDTLDEFMFLVPHGSSQFAQTVRLSNPLSRLHEIPNKIENIERQIKGIITLDELCQMNPICNTIPEEGSSSGSRQQHQVTPYVFDCEKMVGYEEDADQLISQLTDGGSTRVIYVVGPPGSGKTLLVKNVYESKRIQRQFDCLAWVHVSQQPKVEEHMRSMLEQFCALRKEPAPPEGVDTVAKLRHYLQQKRYVVVLDDVRNKETSDDILKVLSSVSSGCRIIVTTQNKEVASSFTEMPPPYVHTLTGLPWEKAKDLFIKKAFPTGNGKCPPHLVDLFQKILVRCQGLPFAIVAVGALLSNKNTIPSEWKKVHDSLGYGIESNSDLSVISRILRPSYRDLLANLKSCFLFFSVFPEDSSVSRGRLLRLWIAEGFVPKSRRKSPEEIAEEYLHELVKRSLIHVNGWDFDAQPRHCQVTGPMRTFIIQRAEEINFASAVAEPGTRRLCINDNCTIQPGKKHLSSVRSLFTFKRGEVSITLITKVLRALKLLKVLDLCDVPLHEFPEVIVHLSLLRYLCLRNTNIKKLPNSIEKLSYLETLDLKQTEVTKLPSGILRLNNLRHLLIYCYKVKNYVTWDSVQGVEMIEGIGGLTNLYKLSLGKLVAKSHKIVQELGALTQLRKLGLTNLSRKDGKHLCASVQKMTALSTLDISSTRKEESLVLDDLHVPPPHLQRLYLKGRLERFPEWISSLGNLLRIGLKWSRLENCPLDILGELPNLMELQMVDVFVGTELVFKAKKFKKLKVMHIEQFDQINMVKIEERAMPELQKLTLCKCDELKTLPLGIENLACLKELLLYDMPGELIDQLEKSSEDRWMVQQVQYIQSFVLGDKGSWLLDRNLS